jgi:hypothetical protein
MSHQVCTKSYTLSMCSARACRVIHEAERPSIHFAAHNCLVLWTVMSHITLATISRHRQTHPITPTPVSDGHDPHCAFPVVLHPGTFAPYSLRALYSNWTVVSLRSCYIGAMCGENTLHHSHALVRSNELWSSVLW